MIDADERTCGNCRHKRGKHGVGGSPCLVTICKCRDFVCQHEELRQAAGDEVGHRLPFICVFCSTDLETSDGRRVR